MNFDSGKSRRNRLVDQTSPERKAKESPALTKFPAYAELIEECSLDHYHLTGQSLGRQ